MHENIFNMRKSMLRKEKFTKIFFICRTYEQFLICEKSYFREEKLLVSQTKLFEIKKI